MNTIFKVRHKPTGRFLTGSNYPRNALRLTGKPPVGKIWNFYKDAKKYADWLSDPFPKPNNLNYDPIELEIVEYRLVEESTTQVK